MLYAVYAKDHGFTKTCTAVYTELDKNGDCIYTYTCGVCGYVGTFVRPAGQALTETSIYETVNGDYLTAYISFGKTVSLSGFARIYTSAVYQLTGGILYKGFLYRRIWRGPKSLYACGADGGNNG